MYLCVGTFLTSLLQGKASSTKQKKLGDAVFRSINPRYDAGDDDSAISAVFRGKRNLNTYLQLDMEDIDTRELVIQFEKNVIPLLDENKYTLVVRLLQELIKSDEIEDYTHVELVNKIKKKDLVQMNEIVLEDFLAGIFIYAVIKTDNLNKQRYVKEFLTFAKSVDRKNLRKVNFIPQYSASVIFNDDVIRPVCTVIKQTGKVIDIIVADILHLNKEPAIKSRRNVVIPVNTSFETRFYGHIGDTSIPLVSANTIHGQWIEHVQKNGVTSEMLDAQIVNSLRRNGYSKSAVRNTKVGKQDVYPFASIAVVEAGKEHYYLLAISEFDKKNKASSSIERIEKALDEIIDYYYIDGQGYDLYIPLIGTGRSRVGLSEQESYEMIRNKLRQRKDDIFGRVHIVVHPEQISQLNLEV